MQADGLSLDNKLKVIATNDIPDILTQYQQWQATQAGFEDRKQQAFVIDKQAIADNKYDLSINRYKEIEYEEVVYNPPLVILDQLEALESEIQQNLAELRTMLK